MSFHIYPDLSHLLQLTAAMLIENLGYRQLVMWWRMQGTVKWLAGRPSEWGDMRRSASWQVPKERP